MIVYHESVRTFLDQCLLTKPGEKDISDIVAEDMCKHSLTSFGASQKEAWKNSLPAMAKVLEKSDIDREVEVAIEYKPSISKDRIDFLLCGIDNNGKRNVVVVELKQWSDANHSNKPDFVFTNGGSGLGDYWHPSYQAGNYINIMRNFNAYIQDQKVGMHACSYLHNMQEKFSSFLDDVRLFPLVESAPAYLQGDAQKLQEFLEKYVSKPYRSEHNPGLLYEIDNSELRPSGQLADMLTSALQGNEFFSYDEGQANAVATIVSTVRHCLYYRQKKTIIIQGGPGSGKSVVALRAMGQLISGTKHEKKLTCAYVTANAAPKNLYKQELIGGNYKKAALKELFKDPSSFVRSRENDFACLFADEGHRVYNYAAGSHGISKEGPNAIELIIRAAMVSVFFVDDDQQVTVYDYGTIDHIKQAAYREHSEVIMGDDLKLTSEFRCLGGEDYMRFIRGFLGYEKAIPYILKPHQYDFRVFDYAADMREEIRKRDEEERQKHLPSGFSLASSGKCRMVSGYTFDWKTKKSRREDPGYDIALDEDTSKPFYAKWNLFLPSVGEGYSWLDDPDSVEEVGCIHTCQGLDMPYCGVIIGKDMTFDKIQHRLAFHQDTGVTTDTASGIHQSSTSLELATRLIRNTYHVLLTRGMKGTYVYCEDRALRDYLKSLLH